MAYCQTSKRELQLFLASSPLEFITIDTLGALFSYCERKQVRNRNVWQVIEGHPSDDNRQDIAVTRQIRHYDAENQND